MADSTPSIHIKAGTKLAKVSVANKAIVKNAMGALEKAEDGGDKAAAGAVITDVAGTQGTYYHKTGPVPKQTKKAAKADLTAYAGSIGKDIVTKNVPKNVPGEALRVYHDALVKDAVRLAVDKVSELRHKKDVVNKLQVSKDSVPALPQSELLEDEVKAAKDVRDATVKQMARGNPSV